MTISNLLIKASQKPLLLKTRKAIKMIKEEYKVCKKTIQLRDTLSCLLVLKTSNSPIEAS